MSTEEIERLILDLFREKSSLKNIGLEESYFNRGVSSLTIVQLQMEVEEALGVTIPTSDLMLFSTVSEWIEAYSTKLTGASAAV